MSTIHVPLRVIFSLAISMCIAASAYAFSPDTPLPSVSEAMSDSLAIAPSNADASVNLSGASALVLCVSCGEDEEKGAARPQTLCPIMGLPVNKELHVDVRGQRIYVCCPGCVAPVRKDPDAALATLHDRNEYAESLQTMCPVMNAPISKEMFVEYKGRRIYVCCPPCIETIQADPARYAAIVAGDDPEKNDAPKQRDGASAATGSVTPTPPAPGAASTAKDTEPAASTSTDDGAESSSESTAPLPRPQTRCPIMDNPVTPGTSAHVDAKGYRIYICCPPCRAKVEADPDAALAAIRARGEEPEPLPVGTAD